MLREHFSEINIDEFGFLGSEDEKPDYLIKQTSLFNNLFKASKEYNIWNQLEKELSENLNEELFSQYNLKIKKVVE